MSAEHSPQPASGRMSSWSRPCLVAFLAAWSPFVIAVYMILGISWRLPNIFCGKIDPWIAKKMPLTSVHRRVCKRRWIASVVVVTGKLLIADSSEQQQHRTKAATEKQHDLWCYRCDTMVDGDRCLDLVGNHSYMHTKCHKEQKKCQVGLSVWLRKVVTSWWTGI